MIATRTIGRLAAAAVLVATVTVVSLGSPAGAEDPTTTTTTEAPTTTTTEAPVVYPTGSLVSNGDGTVTLTYANSDAGDLYVFFLPTSGTCGDDPSTTFRNDMFVLSNSSSLGQSLSPSPMVIGVGAAVVTLPNYPTAFDIVPSTLPEGAYKTCLYASSAEAYSLLSSAVLEIAPAPPAPEPVVPAYTG